MDDDTDVERQFRSVAKDSGSVDDEEVTMNGPPRHSSSATQAAPSSNSPPPPPRLTRARAELRRITLNFTPSWFSVNMGTGITSILLHELPYQFRGLHTIANVVFGLNVVLFCVFLALSVARYTVWPRMAALMLFHPAQSLFLGTFAMGFATIVNMCALSAAPAWNPNGGAFVTFTWALWWIDVAVSVLVCTTLPFLQFTRHVQAFDQVTGVWLLPLVSPIVAAASGGIVAPLLGPSQARLTIIVSYVLWGMGFLTAMLIMALYYGRQAIYKIPPASVIVSVFLPLGPCGQGAFALLKLASTLYDVTERDGYALGGNTSASDAHIIATAIYGVSVPVALIIWGLGLFWLVLAVATLIDLARVARLQFNLGWWAFTFPLGVFCTATTQLGRTLDSGAFRILGTVLSLVEVALWLVISTTTLVRVCRGQLFFSPCLAEQGGEPPTTLAPSRKYTYEPR